MAVLNPRTVAVLAIGVGIGAALVHRRQHVEPCCEKPAGGTSCC
jgi:hypothetical protein